MKKKWLLWALTFALAFSVTACGNKQKASITEKNTTVEEKGTEQSDESKAAEKDTTSDSIDVLTIGTTMEFVTPSRADYNTGIITGGLVTLKLATKDEAGINVVIDSVDAATFSQIADVDHTHVALLTGATPAGMNTNAGCGTAYYDSRYYAWSMVEDETFHTIVDGMLSATTMDEYDKLAEDVQEWYVENIPIIPLYNDAYVLAYSSKLDNLYYDGNYGLNNVYTMYEITKAE